MSSDEFVSIIPGRTSCHCCFFLTLSLPRPEHNEICPVCIWEDDPAQNQNSRKKRGGNEVSLETARLNFLRYGACEPNLRRLARNPLAEELPWPGQIIDLKPAEKKFVLRKVKTQVLVIAFSMYERDIETLRGCSAISFIAEPLQNDPVLSRYIQFFDRIAIKASTLVYSKRQDGSLKKSKDGAAIYRRQIQSDVDHNCVVLIGLLLHQLLKGVGNSQK